MDKNSYIIRFDALLRPHNCYMALPLDLLMELNALIHEEIMKGKVGSDAHDRVILHLLLDPAKIVMVEEAVMAYGERRKRA